MYFKLEQVINALGDLIYLLALVLMTLALKGAALLVCVGAVLFVLISVVWATAAEWAEWAIF